MDVTELLPTFHFTDAHGRELTYTYFNNEYYVTWTNPPPGYANRVKPKQITRLQYAYGLLAKVEEYTQGYTFYVPDFTSPLKTEAEQDLDDWFGEKGKAYD